MISIGRIVVLVAVWVLLWGDVSVANVLSGVVLSVLLLLVNPDPHLREGGLRRPRPVAVARLVWHIVVQLVVSNALVSREIVARRSRIRAGVVACDLRVRSERIITFLANVLSLSPGTMPVEVRVEPPTIYIHVLHVRDPVESRRTVARLEELAVRAFGTPDDVERVLVAADLRRPTLRRRRRA